MKVIAAKYYDENGRRVVDLKFKSIDQLLDPSDHSPLERKELTDEAEEAVINNAFAGGLNKRLTINLELPEVQTLESSLRICSAVRNHFRYTLSEHERDTAIFIRERRISFFFTILNILIALVYVEYASLHEDWMYSKLGIIIGTVIIIINWATIWDTYEFFIYDSRQRHQKKKLLTRIIDADITIISSDKGT